MQRNANERSVLQNEEGHETDEIHPAVWIHQFDCTSVQHLLNLVPAKHRYPSVSTLVKTENGGEQQRPLYVATNKKSILEGPTHPQYATTRLKWSALIKAR